LTTFLTPVTPLATVSARAFCSGEGTAPLR
jgi:hypothetical protein